VLFNEIDGVQPVLALGDKMDLGKTLEEKGELFPGGLFVVDDDGVDGHEL